jgi:hypothetical protein
MRNKTVMNWLTCIAEEKLISAHNSSRAAGRLPFSIIHLKAQVKAQATGTVTLFSLDAIQAPVSNQF